jgi:tight adherence protein C
VSTELLLAIVGVFGSVALIVGAAVSYALTQSAPARRRLEQAQKSGQSVLLENPTLTEEPSPLVKRMASFLPRSPKEVSALRKRMMRAGYHDLSALAVYTLAQVVLPITLGLLPLVWTTITGGWYFMAFGAFIGYMLPGLILDRLIAKRQKQIQNGLPDMLDLLIVCLEAGSSLDQGIMKATDELELAYPALAEEFRMLITETRAGKPRLEAFRNLAGRTGVEDIRSLVAMLVQTDRFGTSVSQALRTHAEVSRTKRRQRAEERAAKIGVKLVFPLVFLLFPAFFTVTLGPAVIRFVRVLFGQVMGQ